MASAHVHSDGISYKGAIAITPSDTVAVSPRPNAIIIDNGGTDGTIAMAFEDGTTLTVDAVAGTIYPYSPKLVKSTGTTATSIKGLM